MNSIIELIFINSLISAFILLFITKIGLRERIIIHSSQLLSELFDCDFCLSWWVNLVIMLGLWGVGMYDYSIIMCIFIPICGTPITRLIL
jgi:hypothetical protein